MKHIKHLVSEDFANTLMEDFGYQTDVVTEKVEKDGEEVEKTEEVVEEAETTQNFYKYDGKLYEWNENVEEFDGNLYIQITELAKNVVVSLEEGSYSILEAVELDETEYTLSEDVFEDEEGSTFVQLLTLKSSD